MPEARLWWVVCTQVAAMAVSLAALTTWGLFTPEFFFTVSFIELLVVSQLFAPVDCAPAWWRRLRWVTVAGFVVFGAIVFQRVSELLA